MTAGTQAGQQIDFINVTINSGGVTALQGPAAVLIRGILDWQKGEIADLPSLSAVLRDSLITIHRVLAGQENRGDKMSLVYDFVTSDEFRMQVDAIVAAALDEIMAWTAILTENVMVMTGTLELRYRKPAAVAASFTLQGELLERRGRRLNRRR